ncbi:MAG: hypothetical protein IJL06_05765 [Kiritimatiellae bacterium]|nr:hypothetical protein [Kiritimatiellia bacterium]
MPRVLPLLLLCAAAHAAEVAQFRAENFGEEWRAARGGATLVADWDARRGLPTEDDRVAVADGMMVDRSERESVPLRGPGTFV